MAQYKDIDAILNSLPNDLPYKASVKRVLIQAPEADVVPKSEVEKIFEEIENLFHKYDVDPNYTFDSMEKDITELKKKICGG